MRLYRLLLLLYPAHFRREHGREMEALFRDRLRKARGPVEHLRIWLWVVGDTVENAWALRRRDAVRSRRRGEGTTMTTLLQDIRYALRTLARAPGFTLAAVLILTVGLGANVTVFTLVDALLFRPPPWEDPQEVVLVYQDSDDGEPSSSSFPAYRDMTESEVFSSVSAMSQGFGGMVVWDGPDGPVEPTVEYATSSYLDVVGLSPLRGRWFGPEHDAVGSEPVAVVSATAWRTRMGSDPDVVGRVIRLNGQPVRIIGVGPEGVPGSYPPGVTDFWLSISSTPVPGPYRVANLDRRADHWYDIRARLAPGVTVEQAQAAMDALALRLGEDFPEFNQGRGITVFRSTEVRVHPTADAQLYLMGGLLGAVVLTVLLLTCANLANLLLVRGLGRSGEMAIRRALGAGRGRVARLFLVESLLLAVLGGLGGVLAARWAVGLLPTLPLPMPGWESIELAIDARVGLFATGLVALTGILFGLAPALRSARSDVSGALRDESRTASLGRGTRRLRNGLVAVQVAASLVLVLGTGLLARSLASLQRVDPGLDADRVAWVQADLGRAGLQGEEARVALDQLVERISSLPGVSRATVTSRLPAQGGGSTTTIVEGYDPPGGTEAVELDFAQVGDDFLATMGIPLVAGRFFDDQDVPGGPTAMLVNETAARRFWGSPEAALGMRVRSQGTDTPWRPVVGVVGDVPVGGLGEPTPPMIYFSLRQTGTGRPYLLARTEGDPTTLLTPMRDAVPQVRASLTVRGQGTLAGQLGQSLAAPRAAAGLMGGFSLLAVILAALGIYAVVSFSVARRTGELGIRMALGAGRSRVTRMVVREVLGTVAVGVVVGLGLAWLAADRIQGLLHGVDALDPVSFGGAVLFLAVVAALAAWIPARRAARTDPVDALRVT